MRTFTLSLAVTLGVAAPAAAGVLDLGDLLGDPAEFAGQVITVEGELIGDFQRRGEWVWVQLNGDSYADTPAPEGGALTGSNLGIAVRFAAGPFDAAGFESPGGYGVRGPVVRVTGEWRFHDETRGGETYLAVASFEIIERERRFDEELPLGVLLLGLALLALGGGVALASRRRFA